jgi:hypothetical protein
MSGTRRTDFADGAAVSGSVPELAEGSRCRTDFPAESSLAHEGESDELITGNDSGVFISTAAIGLRHSARNKKKFGESEDLGIKE